MVEHIHLRWIAEAEARSVQAFAQIQKDASQPPLSLSAIRSEGRVSGWIGRRGRAIAAALARARAFSRALKTSIKARLAGVPRSSTDAALDRVLAAVLITDIVGSTRQAADLGDRRWIGVIDRHDAIARRLIREFGGRCVRNRGDGFLAVFASPARAIRCAAAIAAAMEPLGLSLRSGVHAGEIALKRGRVNGIAVHVAARITAAAHPGEVFVSRTVRELVTGAEFAFEDRGMHGLRGLPEEVHLYAMSAAGRATADTGSASIIRLTDRRYA
jgi:class 3 adenylate cyclase